MKKIICTLIIVMLSGLVPVSAEEHIGTVKASILMEASTGAVLSEENADEQLPIASVTKIMTMLLIMERIDSGQMTLEDIVTASENANSYGGSTMFLEVGEQLSVHEMLKGIAVASANDGCVAMAEHIAGSEEAFAELMNQRAAELGMQNTHFMNASGLDIDGHYSSARDVAIMSRELIKHDTIFNYTKIWMDSMRDGKFELVNTNRLIRYYNGATGLKTGSTSKAGCCLSATAERDGMELIAVVLGAENTKTRFAKSSELLNFGYANYSISRQVEKGENMGYVKVRQGVSKEIGAEAIEDYSVLMQKSQPQQIERTVKMKDSVRAPVEKGDKIGEITFSEGENVVKTVDIVASEAVAKKSLARMIMDMIMSWVSFFA